MAMALFLLIAISVASLISISDAAPAESRINEAGNLAGHTVLKASILARRKRSLVPSNNGLFAIPKPGGAGPDDARAFLPTSKGGVGTHAGAGEAGWKTPTSGGQIQASSNIGAGTIIGGGIKGAIGVDPPKYRVDAGFAVDRSGAGFEENLPRPAIGVGIDPGFSGVGGGGGTKPYFWGGVDTGFSGGAGGGLWPSFEEGIRPGYNVGAGIGGAWPSFADGIRVGFILGAGLGGRWPSFGGGVDYGFSWRGGGGGNKLPVGVGGDDSGFGWGGAGGGTKPPVGAGIDPWFNGGGGDGGFKPNFDLSLDSGFNWGGGGGVTKLPVGVGGVDHDFSWGGAGGGTELPVGVGWQAGGSTGQGAATGWGAKLIGGGIGGGVGGGGGGGRGGGGGGGGEGGRHKYNGIAA